MDIHYLDTHCGFCFGLGRREVPGAAWVTGPTCRSCGGIGYVVTEDGAHLLVFLERHLGPVLHGAWEPSPPGEATGRAVARRR